MSETLAITCPIYLVIALGFLAGHFGVFSRPDMRVLGSYVVKFALPALVFTALSQRSFNCSRTERVSGSSALRTRPTAPRAAAP